MSWQSGDDDSEVTRRATPILRPGFQQANTALDPSPFAEIELVHETNPEAPSADWPAFQIETKNRFYRLNGDMRCIQVLDSSTGQVQTSHPLLGARLSGGQRREGNTIIITQPYPQPGAEAIFEVQHGRRTQFSYTSSVEKVTIRLRILTVTADNLEETLTDISAARLRRLGSDHGK